MDRKLLKQNARMSFKRKHGESIVVALIMGLFSNSAGGYSFSNYGQYSTDPEAYYEYSAGTGSLEDAFNAIPENFYEIFLGVFISVFTVVSLVSIFLAPIFTVGGNRFFMKLRKGVNTGIGEVTGNFKDGNYWNIVKIFLVKNIKIALWSLLFIIPGIYKTFEYFLIDYILAVRPDIDRKSAFTLSKRLMDGYKGEAFVLSLSFIGWVLLSTFFTCGILSIAYVNPYMYATFNEFYAFVRAEGIRKGIITPMDLPDYEAPVQDGFNMNNGIGWQQGSQNQYQQPQNIQAPYQQAPFVQQQETQQAPFPKQPNEPVANVDTMPNDNLQDKTNTATEVPFTPIDNENNEA